MPFGFHKFFTTICNGDDPVAFTVSGIASGAGVLTYQWQSQTSLAGPWVNIPGATQATYDPPNLFVTTWYRRIVTTTLNGNSCTAISNILEVTINDINAGTIGADQVISRDE